MTGQTKAKRKSTTFEHTAGTLPTLRRAAPRPAAPLAEAAAEPDETSETPVPGFLSNREVILRLVETLKAL